VTITDAWIESKSISAFLHARLQINGAASLPDNDSVMILDND